MAYKLTYWEEKDKDTHYELRSVRLSSVEEAVPLSLSHNRPHKCSLITLERNRNYKNKKWIDEKIVWEASTDRIICPIVLPHKTKKT